MPNMGRLCSALAVPFVLSATAAEAQVTHWALVAPAEAVPARSGLPDFRMPRGDYRVPPGPVQGGLVGAVPLGRNLQVAVGRFVVPDIAAPREAAEIRRRDRRIAAVGFSFRF